jgi:hypothetical protein
LHNWDRKRRNTKPRIEKLFSISSGEKVVWPPLLWPSPFFFFREVYLYPSDMGRRILLGYWLNPATGRCVKVATSHDEWIRDRQQVADLGLPDSVHQEIIGYAPTDIDPIRLAAVRAGLVRVREHRRYVSVQYMADADRVGAVLGAVAKALTDLGIHPDTRLVVDNLQLEESREMTARELESRPPSHPYANMQ